jgi:hypothetical protein
MLFVYAFKKPSSEGVVYKERPPSRLEAKKAKKESAAVCIHGLYIHLSSSVIFVN